MMKRITALVAVLFICLSAVSTVFALENIEDTGLDNGISDELLSVTDISSGFVFDDLNKLADSERAQIDSAAENVYRIKGVAIAVIITDSVEADDTGGYVVSRLAERGYDKNAIALLLDFGKNKCDVFASGNVKTMVSQSDLDDLAQLYVQSDNCYEGINSFIGGVLLRLGTRGARVVDMADLLTADELVTLRGKADKVSEKLGFDIVISTVDSLQGRTPEVFADDFYDYNGYGYGQENDGILFLISMEDRDWAISTSGYGIYAFTDVGQEHLIGKIKSDLSAGRYYDCFTEFIDLCEDYVNQARTKHPYDTDDYKRKPTIVNIVFMLLKSTGVGSLISNITMKAKRSSYRTVKRVNTANNYAVNNSLKLSDNRDTFLYRNVIRSARVSETSSSGSSPRYGHSGGSTTHVSSSGHTHGGSHGKF